jgi:hypothetical protein
MPSKGPSPGSPSGIASRRTCIGGGLKSRAGTERVRCWCLSPSSLFGCADHDGGRCPCSAGRSRAVALDETWSVCGRRSGFGNGTNTGVAYTSAGFMERRAWRVQQLVDGHHGGNPSLNPGTRYHLDRACLTSSPRARGDYDIIRRSRAPTQDGIPEPAAHCQFKGTSLTGRGRPQHRGRPMARDRVPRCKGIRSGWTVRPSHRRR